MYLYPSFSLHSNRHTHISASCLKNDQVLSISLSLLAINSTFSFSTSEDVRVTDFLSIGCKALWEVCTKEEFCFYLKKKKRMFLKYSTRITVHFHVSRVESQIYRLPDLCVVFTKRFQDFCQYLHTLFYTLDIEL